MVSPLSDLSPSACSWSVLGGLSSSEDTRTFTILFCISLIRRFYVAARLSKESTSLPKISGGKLEKSFISADLSI